MSSYRVNASSSRTICRFFANGHCKYGSTCHYLHTREGSSPHNRNSDGDEHNNYNNGGSSSSTLHKSNSNSNYRRSNSNNNGSSTPTRHTVTLNNRVPPENLLVCKYFLEDRCMFGDSCW